MAFNSYFPTGYQQVIPQAFVPQNNVQNNPIIWVQGEAGAKSYMVAPNQTVQLWDSESQVIYLKSANASGMPSIKILDYTVRDDTPKIEAKQTAVYATKDDIDSLQKELSKIKNQLGSRKEKDK